MRDVLKVSGRVSPRVRVRRDPRDDPLLREWNTFDDAAPVSDELREQIVLRLEAARSRVASELRDLCRGASRARGVWASTVPEEAGELVRRGDD